MARTTVSHAGQRSASAQGASRRRARRGRNSNTCVCRRASRASTWSSRPLRTRTTLERRRPGPASSTVRPRRVRTTTLRRRSTATLRRSGDRANSRRRFGDTVVYHARVPAGRGRRVAACSEHYRRCGTLVAMRIGMLTGGGDCPGLNAVIRAVVRKGEGVYGHEIVGFRHGWRGVIDGRDGRAHHRRRRAAWSTAAARSSARRARTRTRPTTASARVLDTLERERIDALIAIGGEDTLGVAAAARRRRASPSSACRRRSTTTSRPPTSRSGSTPRCRSRPTPSTACTPPPRATTA